MRRRSVGGGADVRAVPPHRNSMAVSVKDGKHRAVPEAGEDEKVNEVSRGDPVPRARVFAEDKESREGKVVCAIVRMAAQDARKTKLGGENRLGIRRKDATHGSGQSAEGVDLMGSCLTGGPLKHLQARVDGAEAIAVGLPEPEVPSTEGDAQARERGVEG